MKQYLLRLFLFVGISIFAAACGANGENEATTPAPATPLATALSEDAAATPENAVAVIIDNIRLLVLQSDPVQVDLTITGNLPNGCTILQGVTQERQENNFIVQVQASYDDQMPCTEALVPFSETLALDVADLPDGVYTVQVGDKSDSFALGAAASTGGEGTVGGGTIRGSVWYDYCDVQADGTPTTGCVDAGNGTWRGDGLYVEGESRIIGVELLISSGQCPADGAAASDVLFTTTRTDATGSYLFGGLPAGPHCISVNAFSDLNIGILPPGIWTFPRAAEVSINQTIDLAPGEVKGDVDFGWDYQLVATTPQETSCTNKVTYVADVTIPDNTVMTPGQEFVKTWRLRNDGDCAWTTAYALEFMEGEAMGFAGTQPLTTQVEPGQETEISVTLIAPDTPGTYRSDWQISDEQGNFFGLGANADVSFYVQIVVQ